MTARSSNIPRHRKLSKYAKRRQLRKNRRNNNTSERHYLT